MKVPNRKKNARRAFGKQPPLLLPVTLEQVMQALEPLLPALPLPELPTLPVTTEDGRYSFPVAEPDA